MHEPDIEYLDRALISWPNLVGLMPQVDGSSWDCSECITKVVLSHDIVPGGLDPKDFMAYQLEATLESSQDRRMLSQLA